MTPRAIVLRVLAVAISLGLLVWLAAGARWQGVGARLAALDPRALGGVALLFAASYAMRAARIHGEFRDDIARAHEGDEIARERQGDAVVRTDATAADGYVRILRLTLVHNALVNVLPFRSGEAAFPVLLGRWFGVRAKRAVVSLLWLRAQDATVMGALAALVWPGVPMVARIAALVAIAGLAWAVPAWARRHAVEVSMNSAHDGASTVRALLARSTRRNVAGWAWTVGNWTVKLVAETWLLALVLAPGGIATTAPTTMPPQATTAALGAIGAELAAILPIQGVAGFGTFEAGAAALMRIEDVPVASGVEAALVLHAVVLALAVLAGLGAALALPGPPRTAPA